MFEWVIICLFNKWKFVIKLMRMFAAYGCITDILNSWTETPTAKMTGKQDEFACYELCRLTRVNVSQHVICPSGRRAFWITWLYCFSWFNMKNCHLQMVKQRNCHSQSSNTLFNIILLHLFIGFLLCSSCHRYLLLLRKCYTFCSRL